MRRPEPRATTPPANTLPANTLPATNAVAALAKATVVMLVTAIGVVVAGVGPAAASDGDVSWAIVTAANTFGSGRQNYSYTLNPGGHLNDGVVVVNHGRTPLNVAVYAADAFTNGRGQLDLVTKAQTSTGVGAWVHTDRPHLTIPPGETVEVPFTVTLPENVASGEYVGGIVTSLAQVNEGNTTTTNVDRRVGIKILLRVGGELKPALSMEDLHVRYSGTPNPFGKGDATVTYTIHNTGNAILGARQTVAISGPFGHLTVHAGRIDDSPQLLPGDRWKVSIPVHGVAPALNLTGTVTVVPLRTDASGSTAPLAAAETTTHAWTVPWPLLLLVPVVLCGLAEIWRRVLAIVVSRRCTS